jgi:putative PEP-CTERM system TPR-repeat lipoprotein
VYQFTGDLQQALSTYGKLATLLPTAAHPYLRMAEIQIALKNKDGARDSLKKGLALLPSSVPLQRAMVMLDVDAGKFDDALAHARSLQKSRPKEIAGFGMEGDVHFARKSWKDAANAYRAGLKIAPTTELAERLYAALTFDNQAAEAAKFADGWIKSQPKDGKFRLFLADAANQRKDFATAAGHYRALLAVAPDNAGLINNLAWSLGQMKDPKALELAEKANRLAPNQPAIMDTLGTILVESGKVDQGVEMLAAAVAAAPDAAEVRINYAKALIKAGKKPAAKAELETLSKLGDKYRNQAEVAALLKAL